MCCFSRAVERVADTKIFARSSKDGRQFIVYSMAISAKDDLAMILPLPVPKDSKEDDVKFINLEKYEDFFKDLEEGFPKPPPPPRNGKDDSHGSTREPLKVVEVGSFQASYVPTIKDFKRLDEQFRLPENVWEKLPQYSDSGFAVFKLKKGAKRIHPMAFEFPRANGKQLFFPTVHIHDGKVHDKADFDHMLYCQRARNETLPEQWEESPKLANTFVKVDKAQNIVLADAHIYRHEMMGSLKNQDTVV
jgi:hypothetical protein